ncbi:uncharacterized protein LOC129719566 [Wyeomyia smithii]|uniref:uncharacterized protein LOC129719566 n=1 Tax=Wyeomyia smithii TaxID=174621 RepID=UPI0024681FCD|nr:uncharacterized protein LOC129719566 [Wyeomyia smithii]
MGTIVPGQGSRTVRTEEAVLIILAALGEKLDPTNHPKKFKHVDAIPQSQDTGIQQYAFIEKKEKPVPEASVVANQSASGDLLRDNRRLARLFREIRKILIFSGTLDPVRTTACRKCPLQLPPTCPEDSHSGANESSPGSGRSDDLEERLKKLPDIGSEKIPLLLAGERVQSVPTQATQDLHLLKSPSRPLQTRLALLSTETARAYPAATGTNQTSVSAETEGGFLKRFIKKMGWLDNSKVRLRMSSCYLYESVADCVNYNEFFTYFNMPNSFNTWFLITELHVWMLLVRAMAEGPEKDAAGRFMRNCIVETMWNDVTTRVKQLAADNPSAVRPQIQLLSEQFQATLMAYDEGISSDNKVLSGALWRRFFSSRCEDYEHLELLVKYVRRQMEMLDKTDRYNFAIKPTVKWLPLIEKPGL